MTPAYRNAAIAAAVLLAALGGGYLYADLKADAAAREAVARYERQLPEGTAFSYAGVEGHPLSAGATLSNVRLSPVPGSSSDLTAAAVSVRGLTGGEPGRVSFSHVQLSGHDGPPVSAEQLAVRDFGESGLAALRTGALPDFRDLVVKTAEVDLSDGRRAEVGTLEVAALADGVLRGLALEDVTVQDTGAGHTVRSESARADGIDLGALRRAGQAGELPPVSALGRLELDGLSGQVGGRQAFRTGGIELSGGAAGSDRRLRMALAEAVLPLDGTAAGSAPLGSLRSLGYRQVALSAELDARMAATGSDAHTLDVTALRVAVQDLGTLEARGRVVAGIERLSGRDGVARALRRNARLAALELSFEDASLKRRVFERIARQRGRTPDQVRTALIMQAERMSRQGGPRWRDLAQAWRTFLQDGERISLSVDLDRPVPVGQLAAGVLLQPSRAAERLKVEASAR